MENCNQNLVKPTTLAQKNGNTLKPTNENNINISLCGSDSNPSVYRNENTIGQQSIAINPNPINLNIKTETDWPTIAVGAGSVITALFIAYFSHKTQKNQVKANIATIRAKWIEDLREIASKFIETTSLIINKIQDDEKWFKTEESTNLYSNLVYAQTKISLMLDKSKEKNKETIRTTETIIELIKSHEERSTISEIGQEASKFEKQISEALEKGWQDIKQDLNPTIFGAISRLITINIEKHQ